MNRFVRSRIPLLVALVLCIGLVLLVLFASRGGDTSPVPAAVSTSAATRNDQTAVTDVVKRFIDALAKGDGDTLYALQTDSYKQACSRQDFKSVAQSAKGQRLAGPIKVSIQADKAIAGLFDESGQPATLSFERAADGTWRVVAGVSGRCS